MGISQLKAFVDFLIPRFPIRDLPIMIAFGLIGALIAGCYGIVHDQITYTIGTEYFTHLKFYQFEWADVGLPDRLFVGYIGFLATWWVGVIVAWILSRRLLPNQARSVAYRKIWCGFGIVCATGFLFGTGGFAYGLIRGPDGDYSAWHNTLAGLILTFFLIRAGERAAEES